LTGVSSALVFSPALQSSVVLHESGQPIERVYFPLSGMISLLAVMQLSANPRSSGRCNTISATKTSSIPSDPASFRRIGFETSGKTERRSAVGRVRVVGQIYEYGNDRHFDKRRQSHIFRIARSLIE
jgi:hypothetical protein